jgi:hypothetical protein
LGAAPESRISGTPSGLFFKTTPASPIPENDNEDDDDEDDPIRGIATSTAYRKMLHTAAESQYQTDTSPVRSIGGGETMHNPKRRMMFEGDSPAFKKPRMGSSPGHSFGLDTKWQDPVGMGLCTEEEGKRLFDL